MASCTAQYCFFVEDIDRMWLAIDAHVHLYPCFDVQSALRNSYLHLREALAHMPGRDLQACRYAIALAERSDCYWYRTVMREGGAHFSELTISPGPDGRLLELQLSGGAKMALLPGRQANSAERLEWLCVGADADLPDRAPWRELVQTIRAQGGIPALNWAPGKWLGARRPLVEQVLDECGRSIMLCDTTLRPLGWGTPVLMQRGIDAGISVIRGSDPLPNPGEEGLIGTYGSLVAWPADRAWTASSLCEQLLTQQGRAIGVRNTPWKLGLRLARYYAGAKGSRPQALMSAKG